jgi:hypothetical protein
MNAPQAEISMAASEEVGLKSKVEYDNLLVFLVLRVN